MSEIITQFLKFNKVMSVKVVNNIATQLKVGLTISQFSGGIKEYQASSETIPNFAFIGQFTYSNRGIVFAIDPKIIMLSTQRLFGGEVNFQTYPNKNFTFSECFIGKYILSSIESQLIDKECPVKLNRIEHFMDRAHLFFSDEKVVFIEIKCNVQGENVGKIAMFYPLIFLKQEQKKWSSET